MRQVFGIQFLELGSANRSQIAHYIAVCIDKSISGERPRPKTADHERRRFHRIEILPSDEVKITLRLQEYLQPVEARIDNVSVGGVRCYCEGDELVRAGDILSIELTMPDGAVKCKGKVTYTYNEGVW